MSRARSRSRLSSRDSVACAVQVEPPVCWGQAHVAGQRAVAGVQRGAVTGVAVGGEVDQDIGRKRLVQRERGVGRQAAYVPEDPARHAPLLGLHAGPHGGIGQPPLQTCIDLRGAGVGLVAALAGAQVQAQVGDATQAVSTGRARAQRRGAVAVGLGAAGSALRQQHGSVVDVDNVELRAFAAKSDFQRAGQRGFGAGRRQGLGAHPGW